mgnify:FL=1
MKNRIVFLFGVCFLIGCNSTQSVDYLQSDEFSKQNMPFSEAVRVGNMLYLSGQIGSSSEDPSKVVAGGIGPETRQTMENMKEVLERYGSSMNQVVKCLCMLADIDEWAEMSGEYVKYFPDHKPARSAFAGTGLALNARVEIECWATIN